MKKFAHFIVHNSMAAYLAALLCFCSWAIQSFTNGHSAIGMLTTFVIYGGMSILTVRTNDIYGRGASRTTLPATFFLLACSLLPTLATHLVHAVLFCILACAFYLLLSTYRDRQAMGRYFLAFALIGCVALNIPQLLWATPLLLLSCRVLQSLHIRTCCAALLGLLLPFWIAFAVLYLTDQTGEIPLYANKLLHNGASLVTESSTPFWQHPFMSLTWLLFLFLPGSVNVFSNKSLTQQSRGSHYFIMAATSSILLLVGIYPTLYQSFYPILVLMVALIGSTLFANHLTRGKRIYLLVVIVMWILLISSKLWMPYLTY